MLKTAYKLSRSTELQTEAALALVLTHSVTHWTAWPATGRSALQASRSLAMLQAMSAESPVSISSWWTQACLGRPRGRLHPGLLSGRRPAHLSTARRRASWAGTDSHRRCTWPNIVNHYREFCCRCFAVVSGSSLKRLIQSQTSIVRVSDVDMTSGKPLASVCRILSRSSFSTVLQYLVLCYQPEHMPLNHSQYITCDLIECPIDCCKEDLLRLCQRRYTEFCTVTWVCSG